MSSTIAADRLEYVLVEMRTAVEDIERRGAEGREAPNELNEALLDALRKAREILEEAQSVAEANGVPPMLAFGA
jgi:tellurite resistance protein